MATLGSGYVQQWNASVQRELTSYDERRGRVRRLEDHARRHPRYESQSVDREQLAIGAPLQQPVTNPFFGIIPRSSSLGDPTITRAQLLKPYPRYTTVSLYRNNVGTTIYRGVTAKLEQRLSRGLSYLVSYTRSRLMDDASSVFDASILTGPVANYPVADSFDRAPRARSIRPATFRTCSSRRRCGTCPGDRAAQRRGTACSARWRTTGRWPSSSRCSRESRSP